jgi:DNA polymerase-1
MGAEYRMKLLLVDGNYFMHRAFHMVVKTRDPAYIQKNVLTLFASMVFSEIALHRATHVAVTLDAPNCWRLEIYPRYKERRRKPKDPILVSHPKYREPVEVTDTVGSMIPAAKKMLKAAGIKVYHKNLLESDDLLGSLAARFQEQIPVVISTRDKDMAGLVNDRVTQYWPVEKKFMREKDVLAYYGVRPFQIRDYLSLMGDHVDDIPGVPGVKARSRHSQEQITR